MNDTYLMLLIFFVVDVVVYAAWDIAKRVIAAKQSDSARATSELSQLVERAEHAAARNDAALKSFLEQILKVTNYVEGERRSAKAQAMENAPRGGLRR
jgi:hypothetical protein